MNLSADWPQLLRIALLGTRQSGEAVPTLPDLPPAPDNPREEQVLSAAGALGLMRKAGYTPAATATDLPAAAPAETFPTLGPHGQDALRQLLAGSYADVLPLYLRQLAQHGRRVPHRLLVPLLDHATTHPEVRSDAAAVLGQRGQWLASLNPAWAAVRATTPEADTWETGTPAQRRDYLRHLRRQDPAQARTLLEAALLQEPAKQQAVLLTTLADGLGAADASLIEPYLASKSKDVRQVAASLLARVPGSALVERLWARAVLLITLKKPLIGRNKLEASLPEAWDPAWQADGIEAKDSRFTGEKAAWLGQLLALIPPGRWTAHFNTSPAQLLMLAADGEWATLLLAAWRHALLLHQDATWALAYAELQLERDDVPPLPPSQLAELLGLAAMAQLVLAHLPPQPRFAQPEARWEALLLQAPGPWPAALTTQALRLVDNTLASPAGSPRYAFHYRLVQLLRHMQLAVSPEQLSLCAEALNPLREVESSLNGPISQLLDTLYFRQHLTETLNEPPGPDS